MVYDSICQSASKCVKNKCQPGITNTLKGCKVYSEMPESSLNWLLGHRLKNEKFEEGALTYFYPSKIRQSIHSTGAQHLLPIWQQNIIKWAPSPVLIRVRDVLPLAVINADHFKAVLIKSKAHRAFKPSKYMYHSDHWIV